MDKDRAYATLVRDLATLIMGVSQGTGTTVCAVVRPVPDLIWVSLAPGNQLRYRYGLQLPLLGSSGYPRAFADVLPILRRSESIRKHDRSRFEGLEIVGNLHGITVREASNILNDPSLAMPQDALRATVLTAAFRGPVSSPVVTESWLAGFTWLSQDESTWVRLYVDIPTEPDVIGLDLDIPTEPGVIGTSHERVDDFMAQLDSGIPAAWSPSEQEFPDEFCSRLFDLRSAR